MTLLTEPYRPVNYARYTEGGAGAVLWGRPPPCSQLEATLTNLYVVEQYRVQVEIVFVYIRNHLVLDSGRYKLSSYDFVKETEHNCFSTFLYRMTYKYI